MEALNSQNNGAKDPATSLGLISVVCGVAALLLFLALINIPLAIVALVAGVIGLRAGGTVRAMCMVGIVCAVLSVVGGILSWGILVTHVPTGGVKNSQDINQFLQQYVEEQNNGDSSIKQGV